MAAIFKQVKEMLCGNTSWPFLWVVFCLLLPHVVLKKKKKWNNWMWFFVRQGQCKKEIYGFKDKLLIHSSESTSLFRLTFDCHTCLSICTKTCRNFRQVTSWKLFSLWIIQSEKQKRKSYLNRLDYPLMKSAFSKQ